ncbi:MAG TPA: hypothetical protein VHX86_15130 [Tepidisphaeraceae bacterium]|jgi:hypothetical protein|nr:hypothetical protein [Tepidisphaeraceae bacterium]
MYSGRFWRGASIVTLLTALMLLACSGCEVVGVAANIVGPGDVPAAYAGLKGQRVAVVVWADPAVMMDHPRISADVATSLQHKFQQAQDAGVNELKGTKFLPTNQILRFQDAHPELQSDSAEQIALRLPVTRLVYVEVVSFSLHPNDSPDLSRGEAAANVKVIEVTNHKAKATYENDEISCAYPPNSPPEGLPNLDEQTVYHKSVDAMTTEVAKLFMSYEADTDTGQ